MNSTNSLQSSHVGATSVFPSLVVVRPYRSWKNGLSRSKFWFVWQYFLTNEETGCSTRRNTATIIKEDRKRVQEKKFIVINKAVRV
jgi:hypothetical protein